MAIKDYSKFDATKMARLVEKGDVKPSELLEEAIARTEALNPVLNAVVLKLYDQAKALAKKKKRSNGPLAGVPFLLKDLGTSLKDTPTTYGCVLFKDNIPDHDSHLVQRYEAAGLNIFGKTATPEFGLTTSTESVLWGPTHNPWKLDHTPGGSSGGAAAAVAAGIVPAADGSDGGGSIRIPASCCGLVGLKPSRGRIPMGPDKGESWSGMSTGGAISRSVRDSALLFDVSTGYAAGDPYTAPETKSAVKAIKRQPSKLRIAFHTSPYNGSECHQTCKDAAADAAKLCAKLGHRIEEKAFGYDQQRYARAFRVIVAAQTKRAVDDRLAQLNRALRDDDLEPVTLATYKSADRYSAADYVTALNTIHDASRAIAGFFENYDVILTPTMAAPPMKLGGALRLNHPDSKEFGAALAQTVGFTQLYNATGNPAISLPLYWSKDGLPIGVQFAAAYGADTLLLQLAAQLEEARPWFDRRPPMPDGGK